jgi:hypothetical protein
MKLHKLDKHTTIHYNTKTVGKHPTKRKAPNQNQVINFITDRENDMTYKLLNVNANAKTVKNNGVGYLTGILYLAPADLSGFNVCAMATLAGCKEPCLNTAGRGKFTVVQQARIRKTQQFFNDRQAFMHQLTNDIIKLTQQAKKQGLKPLVRLNGTSDIKWENVRFDYGFAFGKVRSVSIFDLFNGSGVDAGCDDGVGSFVQFYDYTKINNRTTNPDFPANYDLTFSYSGVVGFGKYVDVAVKAGMRVAVVFDKKEVVQDYVRSGARFKGMLVVDGDASDVRHEDGQGVVVGLYAKGKAVKDNSGFVVRS